CHRRGLGCLDRGGFPDAGQRIENLFDAPANRRGRALGVLWTHPRVSGEDRVVVVPSRYFDAMLIIVVVSPLSKGRGASRARNVTRREHVLQKVNGKRLVRQNRQGELGTLLFRK